MYHESKLLWWNAQERQLQIRELMSSACPTVELGMHCCAKLVWQLGTGRVCPANQLPCCRTEWHNRLVLRHVSFWQVYGKIGLLFVNSPLPVSHFGKEISPAKVSSHSPSARASSAIDLIVNVNSQDSTQASRRTNVSRKCHHLIVVQLVPAARGLFRNEHTRIHRVLIGTKLLNEELVKSPPPP